MPRAPEQQGGEDGGQRRLGLVERERLEVAGVVLGDVDADGDVVGRRRSSAFWSALSAVADGVDEALGEVGDRMEHARARPRCGRVAGAEHGEAVGVGAEFVVEEDADAVGVDA